MDGSSFLEDVERCFNEVLGAPRGSVVLKGILERHKGLRLVIPGATKIYRDWRDGEIRKEFNGRNLEELALRWKITMKQVMRIVKN